MMIRASIIAVGLFVVAPGQQLRGNTEEEVPAIEDTAIFSPAVNRVIDSLRTQFQQIEDYQVRLLVSIKMPGLRMPRKRMTFSFKQPDNVHLKARGFAMVPRSGMILSPDSMFARLSSPVLVQSSGVNECPCLTIEGETNLLEEIRPRMEVTVDTVRWVIMKISTLVGDEEVLALETAYTEVLPGIFMPEETKMRFEISEEFLRVNPRAAHARRDTDYQAPDGIEISAEGSEDRFPRTGEAIIRFSRYKVNQGLGDALFEEAE